MDQDVFRKFVRSQNRKIKRLVPEGVKDAAAAFARTVPKAGGAIALAVPQLTNKGAAQALAATHSALAELARRNPARRAHYAELMHATLMELAQATQLDLNTQGQRYQPITQELKAVAASLKAAYQQAKQTITNMNNAAAILSAFAAIVGAL
ncbi:hypothetical protein NKJ26_21200 [Mesorhizobium sp. M0152]|uniref:hypothetical protein n=1 Tax=Mesorhizobium sp. M0152 TaxID=2956898 RepID=UPI0033397A30